MNGDNKKRNFICSHPKRDNGNNEGKGKHYYMLYVVNKKTKIYFLHHVGGAKDRQNQNLMQFSISIIRIASFSSWG